MSFRINANIPAMNALRHLGNTNQSLNSTIERLSSGLRINKAKDDAAGLAISEGMRSDIRVLRQGVRNAHDAISVIQTAEGSLSEINSILTRMKELAMQSAGVMPDNVDRDKMEKEFTQLVSELNRIASGTEFNGTKLLDGTFSAKNVYVGLHDSLNVDKVSITISSKGAATPTGFGADKLELNNKSVSFQTAAISTMSTLDGAIERINSARADLGALQSRFDSMIRNVENVIENTASSESQIRDADIAFESTQFTKYQILQQSGTAMLAQANVSPQSALSLLG